MAKPETMTWVNPYLTVIDGHAALAFYEKAFGFTIREKVEEQEKVIHAEMKYRDAVMMLSTEGSYGCTTKSPRSTGIDSPIMLYVYCEDVDKLHEQAVAAGAQSMLAPQDTFWGDRMCSLKDPDGYTWNFATNLTACPVAKKNC